jgi:hypothetical protein
MERWDVGFIRVAFFMSPHQAWGLLSNYKISGLRHLQDTALGGGGITYTQGSIIICLPLNIMTRRHVDGPRS